MAWDAVYFASILSSRAVRFLAACPGILIWFSMPSWYLRRISLKTHNLASLPLAEGRNSCFGDFRVLVGPFLEGRTGGKWSPEGEEGVVRCPNFKADCP